MTGAEDAAAFIRRQWSTRPELGVILGTGLGGIANEIDVDLKLSYDEIPGFASSTVIGHAGFLLCGHLGSVAIMAMMGRCHFYEGYGTQQVTLPTNVMCALGVTDLFVSNSSGGIRPSMRPGELMVIEDHINMMGYRTVGIGVPHSGRNLYDIELIERVEEMARSRGIVLHRGVYVAVLGPNYETRAEYRAFRRLGGDAVGMSTVPETLTAGHSKPRILAISTIANVAKPDSLVATSAQGVVDVANDAAPNLRELLIGLIDEGCLGSAGNRAER